MKFIIVGLLLLCLAIGATAQDFRGSGPVKVSPGAAATETLILGWNDTVRVVRPSGAIAVEVKRLTFNGFTAMSDSAWQLRRIWVGGTSDTDTTKLNGGVSFTSVGAVDTVIFSGLTARVQVWPWWF